MVSRVFVKSKYFLTKTRETGIKREFLFFSPKPPSISRPNQEASIQIRPREKHLLLRREIGVLPRVTISPPFPLRVGCIMTKLLGVGGEIRRHRYWAWKRGRSDEVESERRERKTQIFVSRLTGCYRYPNPSKVTIICTYFKLPSAFQTYIFKGKQGI